MKEKKDNIYIYLWEEFNTIYVGRTINPKSRHYTHKHRESEKTYQFSSEHGVEHPPMIIIENDLNLEEGVGREKYWIDYYRNNTSYNILNKTCGGQKGRRTTHLSKEEKKQHQREYYQKNKERILAYCKLYRETHKDEIKEKKSSQKYYSMHKEKRSIYRKQYYENNKESLKEKRKEYYNEHKEHFKEYQKQYNKDNREKINEYQKQYNKDNKEKMHEYWKQYYKDNKEKINEYQREYKKKQIS